MNTGPLSEHNSQNEHGKQHGGKKSVGIRVLIALPFSLLPIRCLAAMPFVVIFFAPNPNSSKEVDTYKANLGLVIGYPIFWVMCLIIEVLIFTKLRDSRRYELMLLLIYALGSLYFVNAT